MKQFRFIPYRFQALTTNSFIRLAIEDLAARRCGLFTLTSCCLAAPSRQERRPPSGHATPNGLSSAEGGRIALCSCGSAPVYPCANARGGVGFPDGRSEDRATYSGRYRATIGFEPPADSPAGAGGPSSSTGGASGTHQALVLGIHRRLGCRYRTTRKSRSPGIPSLETFPGASTAISQNNRLRN